MLGGTWFQKQNPFKYSSHEDILYTESNQTVLLLCGTFVSSQSLIKRCFNWDEKCNVCRLAEINVIFNLSRCPILKCEIALLNVRCDSYYKCVEIHLPPCLLSPLSLSLSESPGWASSLHTVTITVAVHPHTSLEPLDSVMTHCVHCLPGEKYWEKSQLPSYQETT